MTKLAINNQQQRVEAALRFHASAHASAAQMAIAAAKCGLELKALKSDLKKTEGHGSWEAFFKQNFEAHGLTLRTGQKYMALADGLKGKALKNESGSFLALLDTPPSKLSEADSKKLTKEVGKVTDGATLSELYQDFGIVKKPQGSGAKGGKTKGSTDGGEPADEAAVLLEGKKAQTQQLIDLLTEGLTDKWFNACDTTTRKKLHGLLVDVQAAVKETL